MDAKLLRVSKKTHTALVAAQARASGKRGQIVSLRAFADEVIAHGLRRIKILTTKPKK